MSAERILKDCKHLDLSASKQTPQYECANWNALEMISASVFVIYCQRCCVCLFVFLLGDYLIKTAL